MKIRIGFTAGAGIAAIMLAGCGQALTSYKQLSSSSQIGVGGGVGSPPGPTPPPATMSPGQLYYTNTITPMIQRSCATCHSEPRFGGTAPLSLYDYRTMRLRVLNGTSAVRNALIDKVTNVVPHTGGDRCAVFGLTGSPCKEIAEWAQIENPAFANGTIAGRIEQVTALGGVLGYAVDVSNIAAAITVNLYVDGASGVGVRVAQVIANQPGPSGGFAGNHRFDLGLPANLRDGRSHTLYVYGVKGGVEYPLPGSPISFAAYAPRAAGQQYYNASVAPLLNARCAACHTFDYEYAYSLLLTPTPFMGGTALNNRMINKPSGTDQGIAHSGGNICGNKNGSPCAEIQQWWAREFQ